MGIVNSTFTTLTGGKGNIGAWNRNAMIWKGRAEAKRTRARVDALEANQELLNNRQAKNAQAGNQQNQQESRAQVTDTLKNINPLNVKNLTVTQIVVAGGSKKDRLKAQKISEKNTKILEQFNKATKEIEKNTKEIKKQDTSIRKKRDAKTVARDYAKKAKKLALKAAEDAKNWLANMKDMLIQLAPSLILSALMASGALAGKQIKKISDKLRGGTRVQKKEAKAKADDWAKKKADILKKIKTGDMDVRKYVSGQLDAIKIRLKTTEAVAKVAQKEAAAALLCCKKGGWKKGGDKAGSKAAEKAGNKNLSKAKQMKADKAAAKAAKVKPGSIKPTKSTVPKINPNKATLLPKSATNLARKAKYSMMGQVLKKLSSGAFKVLALSAGGIFAFMGPAIGVLMGAWLAYDVATTVLLATGQVTPEQIDQFEDWVIQKAKDLATGAYDKLIGDPISKNRQKSISKDRVDRYSEQYFEKAEESLEKLRAAIKNNAEGSVKRKHRHDFGLAVERYTKTLQQGGDYGKTLKLYIFKHLEGTKWGLKKWRTSEEKAKEAKFVTVQLALYRSEKKGVIGEGDVKGTNVKTSNVQNAKARVATENQRARQKSTLANNVKAFAGVNMDVYNSDITFQLGQPVNGLYPPQWQPLETIVPANFRKVIDFIENGNTANYALKGKRSSAFGRYQFMPKTARGMAQKTDGVDETNWRVPVNQDKIFGTLYQQNVRSIVKYASKGVKLDLMSLWIAHNLGAGAVLWMLTGQGKPVPKNHLDNQLGTTGSTTEESKQLYLKLYTEKIAKAINAPIGKATAYGTIEGTGSAGKGGTTNGATSGGSVGGGVYSNGNAYGNLPTMKVEPWTGEVDTSINMKDVIELRGGALRPDAWRMLKPEFKTRILQAAAAYKISTRGKKLIITSAYRDIKVQTELWNKSDKTGRTVARPGGSMHNWGLAVDLGGNNGVDRGKGNQGDYLFASGILKKYKLYRPMSYEPWHIEPIETIGHRGKAGANLELNQGATTNMSGSYSNNSATSFVAPYAPAMGTISTGSIPSGTQPKNNTTAVDFSKTYSGTPTYAASVTSLNNSSVLNARSD